MAILCPACGPSPTTDPARDMITPGASKRTTPGRWRMQSPTSSTGPSSRMQERTTGVQRSHREPVLPRSTAVSGVAVKLQRSPTGPPLASSTDHHLRPVSVWRPLRHTTGGVEGFSLRHPWPRASSTAQSRTSRSGSVPSWCRKRPPPTSCASRPGTARGAARNWGRDKDHVLPPTQADSDYAWPWAGLLDAGPRNGGKAARSRALIGFPPFRAANGAAQRPPV